MPTHILVASPQSSFCELLRSSLEETGKYTVQAAASAEQALACVRDARFDLAILDSDLDDQPVSALGRSLQEQHPNLLVVVIPPENDPQHLSMINFTPDSYLERPFYLPDLLDKLDFLLERSKAPAEAPPAQFWLLRSKTASALLDKQLRETFLHAILVFEPAGPATSHTSGLAEEEAQRLAGVLKPQFKKPASAKRPVLDVVYFDPRGTGERMAYAVALNEGTALAGLMDASVPVSQARAQMQGLRDTLLNLPAEEETAAQAHKPEEQADKETEDFLARLELEGLSEEEGDEGEAPAIDLSDLLAGMPPPNPERMPISAQEWQHLADDEPEEDHSAWEPAVDEAPQPADQPEDAAPTGPGEAPQTPEAPKDEDIAAPPNGKMHPPAPAGEDDLLLPWEGFDELQPDGLEPREEKEQGATVQAVTQATYTCILIPRLVRHTLTIEMGERLKQWLPQHCLAFGWSLEGMAVTAEYLQWTVRVTPSVSQGSVVRVIRQRTSENLFNQYPYLKEQNASGDFWAPGYLMVSGPNPPSPELLRNFIYQTRRRQGLYRF